MKPALAFTAVALGTVLALGGGAAYYLRHERDVAAAEREEGIREAERQARQGERERRVHERAAQEAYDGCVHELQPMLDSLNEINGRLDVGLGLEEYKNLLSDASVSYSRINTMRLDGDCLDAAVNLENAINAYDRAAVTWGSCAGGYDCDVDSIDLQLNRQWNKAADQITDAQDTLAMLDPAWGDFS